MSGRGHGAVEIGPGRRLEPLELLKQVGLVLTGQAGNVLLPGEGGGVAGDAIVLLRHRPRFGSVLPETVTLGAHEDQEPAGLGREPEDGDPARCQQQEVSRTRGRPGDGLSPANGTAHGANPGAAAGTALSNAWLKAQGLVSVKDLWCKAQGYAN